LAPIRVRPVEGGKFAVIDGHYRLAGAIEIGLTEIPVVIDDTPLSAADITGVQIATNQCRFDLNPMEEALAYDSYLRNSQSTAARLASLVGKSEAHISRTRALVGIKSEIQELVASETLGPSLALELDRIADSALYQELLHRAKTGTLTRAELLKANSQMPSARPNPTASKPARPPKLVIPLGQGCSLTISGTVRSITQVLELLQSLVDRARRAREQACDDVASLSSIVPHASGA
jgi:ParB family transcriptional regulator, chromosome partitioning protein